MYPPSFSNLCVYGKCFHRLRVDGRPKRIKKFAFTIVCVYNRLRVDGALVYGVVVAVPVVDAKTRYLNKNDGNSKEKQRDAMN